MILQAEKTLWCSGGGFEEALVDVKIYHDRKTQKAIIVIEDNPDTPETYVGCGTIIDEVIAKIAFVFELNPSKTKWIHVRNLLGEEHVSEVVAKDWKKSPSSQFSNLKVRKVATPQSIYWVRTKLENLKID
ncbi:MAG: hypothetical protein AAF378_00030 [Cyanobacteria bacterium P01_A01_bin.84]